MLQRCLGSGIVRRQGRRMRRVLTPGGGSQVLSFSTGGGHTINHPLMSTIRITGNPVSAKLQRDTLDVDVSDIFTGTTIEEAGRRVYNEVIDVASGKMTKAEILHEDNAFAITRTGPSV